MNEKTLMDFDFLCPLTPPSSPELARQENVHDDQMHEQMYDEVDGTPQFLHENQDFSAQLAADYNRDMPPVPLVQPARDATPMDLVEQPVQVQPLLETDDQTPFTFPNRQPFFPLLQGFQRQRMLSLEAVDPILLTQQMEVDQEEPILQPYKNGQPEASIQEAQMVTPLPEAQPVQQMLPELQNVNIIAAEYEDFAGLLKWLKVERNDEASIIKPLEKKDNSLNVIKTCFHQECLNQSAQQNTSTSRNDDWIHEIQSIMETGNIVEFNPGQHEINHEQTTMDNESQIILIREENEAADLNRIENNPIQNSPVDNGINQTSSVAAQESTSYDPYVFVDEVEPICSYSTFLSNKNIKRRKK